MKKIVGYLIIITINYLLISLIVFAFSLISLKNGKVYDLLWIKYVQKKIYDMTGFRNVFQLEGGIIEYVRQVKRDGIENKFIGKNFVFDERRGERITNDVISLCHQCGRSCDYHVNCANQACHLLFIQCESCQEKRQRCCSSECQDILSLPEENQRQLRKGSHSSNKIFKKGRSKVLKFKH